jgi:tRNA 2-selenouridine synthase
MIQKLDIVEFLKLADTAPIIDVRTPLEFAHARIPGAFNLPIFSNEERVLVGTCYKQKSREEAILLGFDLTGPKWSGFIQDALKIAPDKKILVHCWRGGMRSGAMAWALSLYGFDVYLLEGGYKRFRNWVLDQFKEEYPLLVVGGMTGSGKTNTLIELKNLNQQVIDLEDIAQHQGSAYGSMGKLIQPSQEHFENILASQLVKTDRTKPIWVEDESLSIGRCFIPNSFFKQMRETTLLKLEVPFQKRVDFLVEEYGKLNKEFLIERTLKIGKRLGPLQTKEAIQAIETDQMELFIKMVLVYYDKTYSNGQGKRLAEKVYPLPCKSTNAKENSKILLNHYLKSNVSHLISNI